MFKKKSERPGHLTWINRHHYVKFQWASDGDLTIEELENFIQLAKAEGEVIRLTTHGSTHGGWISATVKSHMNEECSGGQ